jgi:hypothetical protein
MVALPIAPIAVQSYSRSTRFLPVSATRDLNPTSPPPAEGIASLGSCGSNARPYFDLPAFGDDITAKRTMVPVRLPDRLRFLILPFPIQRRRILPTPVPI